ncbi:unnamed protein product [Polarella glacialis]|uniref:Uncharacterized protein n=1 Tax=Polarella glacialis TaxID=89957 RepID=A0A813IAA7_POLGL|nr:unnamed protein product [Polarella glacialis]
MPSQVETKTRRAFFRSNAFTSLGQAGAKPDEAENSDTKLVREATPPRTHGRVSFLRTTWQHARNVHREQKDGIQNAAEESHEEADERATREVFKEEGNPVAQEVIVRDSGNVDRGNNNSSSSSNSNSNNNSNNRSRHFWGSASAVLKGTGAALKNSRMLMEQVKDAAQAAYRRHSIQKQMRDELNAAMKGSADITAAMEEELGNILESVQLMEITDVAECGEHVLNAILDNSDSLSAMQKLRDYLLSHLAALDNLGSTFAGLEARMESILDVAASFNKKMSFSTAGQVVHRINKLRNSVLGEEPAAASEVGASSVLGTSLKAEEVQDPDSLDPVRPLATITTTTTATTTTLFAKMLPEVEPETTPVTQATVPQAPVLQATVPQAPLVPTEPQKLCHNNSNNNSNNEPSDFLPPVTQPEPLSMRAALQAPEAQAFGRDPPDGSQRQQQQPLSPQQLHPARRSQLQSLHTLQQPRLTQQQQLPPLQQQQPLQQQLPMQQLLSQQQQQQIWPVHELPEPVMHTSSEHQRYPIRPMWGVAPRAQEQQKQSPLDPQLHVRHAALKAWLGTNDCFIDKESRRTVRVV